jgi:hypothetical protein
MLPTAKITHNDLKKLETWDLEPYLKWYVPTSMLPTVEKELRFGT